MCNYQSDGAPFELMQLVLFDFEGDDEAVIEYELAFDDVQPKKTIIFGRKISIYFNFSIGYVCNISENWFLRARNAHSSIGSNFKTIRRRQW